MHPTRNDLSKEVRTAMVQLLNACLADVLDLYLQLKQAHWNVKGPAFIAVHELFDDIAGSVLEQSDEIAERVTALGGVAEGSSQVVAKKSSLPAYSLTLSAGRDHVEAVANALAHFGKKVRAAIDTATEKGDADIADLFTGISRGIDKHLWFVEAHLQADR